MVSAVVDPDKDHERREPGEILHLVPTTLLS